MAQHPLMAARTGGVRVPESQSTEQAPVMTITKVLPLEVALVEWGDERGRKHDGLAIVANGKLFVNEGFNEAFKSFTAELQRQANDMYEAAKLRQTEQAKAVATPTVPTEDAVDVTGG